MQFACAAHWCVVLDQVLHRGWWSRRRQRSGFAVRTTPEIEFAAGTFLERFEEHL